MIVLLLIAVLLLAFANGANDNFKATATLYGSGTLGYRGALVLATAAQLTGSLASLFLAFNLLEAFGGKELVPDTTVENPAFLVAVAVGAAGTVLLATRLGMPVSTTHALIGGLVGAGLALAPAQLAWSSLAGRFLLPLLLSPLLAVLVAGGIYPVLSHVRKRLGVDEVTCLCVTETAEAVESRSDGTLVLARTGVVLTVDQVARCRNLYSGSVFGVSAARTVDTLHGLSAFALGVARGLNDTPKVLGLLVAAAWSGLNPRGSLVIVAIAMAIGGVLASRRVAETLGHRITEMNLGQGFVANAVASALVIGASFWALPVSTTHVSTGAIFGIGLWTRRAHPSVVGQIALAWIVTLPLGAAISWLAAIGLGAV